MDIKVDFESHIPIYKQVVDQIIASIASGKLSVGEELPSIRNLSSELDVNPATIVRAYRELEEMGIIQTRKGKKSRVSRLPDNIKEERLVDLYRDFLLEVKKMGYSEKEVLDIVSDISVNSILTVDIGSTTTKSILFLRDSEGKLSFSGLSQARTTVEGKDEDVWDGFIKSLKGLEDKTDWKIIKNDEIIKPSGADGGIDLFLATSSAGGGLQMVTAGLVKVYTAESAERAALDAGAIVMDVLAVDDNRTPFEKNQALKNLKPDIILLSGGIEGGAVSGVMEMAEIIASSEIKGKFGQYSIPFIYAGNSDGREFIKKATKEKFELTITENIRPEIDRENLLPARKEIMRVFMEHVMKRAPGYEKLIGNVSASVMPTPGAVFEILRKYSQDRNLNLVAFDIGGATTDVFSAYEDVVVRTVSANLGLSYSMMQAIEKAGLDNIEKWIPFDINIDELENIAANKMIKPTSLPASEKEHELERAVAKEILSEALDDHKSLAQIRFNEDKLSPDVILKGEKKRMEWHTGRSELIPLYIDRVIGSGGMFAHRSEIESLEILLDGLSLEGLTELYTDSYFMLPHIGVISSLNPALALELIERECLNLLATVISPEGSIKKGRKAFTLKYNDIEREVLMGDFIRIPITDDALEVELIPSRNLNFGNGKGGKIKKIIHPGRFGIICDLRVRPLEPDVEQIGKWRKILSGE